MIVTFCGHSMFQETVEYERKVLAFLEEMVGNQPADMFLGGYGNFDSFAYNCCKKYKTTHKNISLVFVTPYMNIEYQRNHLEFHKTRYDRILYPDLEDKLARFAISYRNKFMIESADYVIAYIDHEWGGAYATYKYAIKKSKVIFNLAEKSGY